MALINTIGGGWIEDGIPTQPATDQRQTVNGNPMSATGVDAVQAQFMADPVMQDKEKLRQNQGGAS